MKKKIFIGVISILIVSVGWIILKTYWQSRQTITRCEQAGGSWTKVGLGQAWYCVIRYRDGGISCTSSTECEGGECIITERGGKAFCIESNIGRQGRCATTIEEYNKAISERRIPQLPCID